MKLREKLRLHLVPLWIIPFAACTSVQVEVTAGITDCYEFYALDADIGEDTFSASGFRACSSGANCPKITDVTIIVFDDNGGGDPSKANNGFPDPGEQVFSRGDGHADPPTECITTGSMAGPKNSKKGGTSWYAEIKNDQGGKTTHGGTF